MTATIEATPLRRVAQEDWVWMPHPAHFIGARECMFRLATEVGGFIVSTVGQWRSTTGEDIGLDRLYETMVFRSSPSPEQCGCVTQIDVTREVDFLGYNDPQEAYAGHLELCEKWSQIDTEESR